MAIFRKRESASAKTPAKRLTFEELETAVAAACSCISSVGDTARTLGALLTFMQPFVTDGAITRVSTSRDLTAEQVTEAIDDVANVFGVSAVTVSVLKAARNLIARAEAVKAAEPEYLTRAELDAALDAMGTAIGCAARCFNQAHFTLHDLLGTLDAAASAASPATRPFVRQILKAVEETPEFKTRRPTFAEATHYQNFGRWPKQDL